MDNLFAIAGSGEDGEFATAETDKCEMKRGLVSTQVSASLEQIAIRVHVVNLRSWTRVTVASVDRLRHRLHNDADVSHIIVIIMIFFIVLLSSLFICLW